MRYYKWYNTNECYLKSGDDIMYNSKLKTCCFFGHRKIAVSDELTSYIKDITEKLIKDKNIDTFLFGSKSQFDDLCYEIVSELKLKYPHIKRIYVRAEFPQIDDNYRRYLLERFEDTYFPEKIVGAGKSVYVERNFEMINSSSFCICYYDENYLPPKRKQSKKALIAYQPASGTKLAYDYAIKRTLTIYNAFDI